MKAKICYSISLIVWLFVAYLLNKNETEVAMFASYIGGCIVISTLCILDEIKELKKIYKDKNNDK